jgi:CHAT domain-containing protein
MHLTLRTAEARVARRDLAGRDGAVFLSVRGAVALVGVTLLLVSAQAAPAQKAERPDEGRSEAPTPAPPAPLRPGEYSLDSDRVVEAVARGEGPQALAYFERLAAQAERQGQPLPAARAHQAAALAAVDMALFSKALQAAHRSLDLFKAAPRAELSATDLIRVTQDYWHIGSAYRQTGDLGRARVALEEGIAFADGQLAGRRDTVIAGIIRNTLATVTYAQHDYATSLSRSGQAAQIFEEVLAHPPPRTSEARKDQLRRLAALALAAGARAELGMGDRDAAEASYARALPYARQIPNRDVEVEILRGQGNIAFARKDWTKALALFQQALPLAGQLKRPTAVMWLNNDSARALGALGRTDDARAASREAVRRAEELRGELADADQRGAFLDDKQGIYRQAVRLALQAQRPDEAFALAERGRSRAFLDMLGSQTTLSKGRTRGLVDEEVRLRARLADARALVRESGDLEESERAGALVEAADRDYRAFLERVRSQSREQASLMAVEPVTVSEIQSRLPVGTTLLEYLVDDEDVIVWTIDRRRATVVRIPGDRQSLVTLVREFRSAIAKRSPLAAVRAQAETLYDRLLGPARDQIEGDRLLIVPHGVLHYVPFGALRSPTHRWVAEEFALATLPSASVLRYIADKDGGASGAGLVVGNPDLGAGLALPWAEREARMVARYEHGATVLVRGDATEAKVKGLLESAGLVHFATHGVLRESDPLSSALLLVPGAGEDGRLEVRELFGFELRARLVVLSACETGLGKLSRGDELVGLQRAFLYAGTPAVITTLWKVDDRASYQLIRSFYARLEKAGPAEALRQAQKETLKAFSHPYSWAGFTLTGVPR